MKRLTVGQYNLYRGMAVGSNGWNENSWQRWLDRVRVWKF